MGGRHIWVGHLALLGAALCMALALSAGGCDGKGLKLSDNWQPSVPLGNQYGPLSAERLGSGVHPVSMRPQQPVDPPFSADTGKLASALSFSAAVRSASFTAGDLIKDGAAYDAAGLPLNRVASVEPSGVFGPVSAPGNPLVLDELAYATYAFTLDGYDGPSTIGFSWDEALAPLTAGGFWVALANWDRQRWDWYSGPLDTVLTLDALATYIEAGTGRLLLLVLATGDQSVSLRQLNIGAPELRATGAIMDLEPLIDNFPAFDSGKSASEAEVVDLSAGCPPVRDQGAAASSTAFAIGDGAFGYELNRIYSAYGWDSADTANLLSPKFMYLLTGQEQGFSCPDEGRMTGLSVEWLKLQGDATELNAPYINICDADWGQEALDDAALLNIEKSLSLDPSGAAGVAKVKTILRLHQVPLVLRINIDPGFFGYTAEHSGGTWDFLGPVVGTQALLIVGFDDAKSAFKVRNSWGADWGADGYGWIRYSTFTDHADWAAPWCWVVYDDYDPAVAQRFCPLQAALAPPANVQASDGEFTDHVALSWEPSSGATGYAIYRDATTAPIATVGDVAAWDDTTVADMYCHTYWVQATLDAELSALSSPDLGFLAQAPQIASVSPLGGVTGTIVQFTAAASGSTPLAFAWSFGGGAVPDTSTDATPVVTLGAVGSYSCALDVTNGLGTAHFDFTLQVREPLYILPDPADTDWGFVTGDGSEANPYVMVTPDYDREYSVLANTLPDGSGEAVDVTTLVWDSFPPFATTWTTPGTFKVNQFTAGYLYASSVDPPRFSNWFYLEVHDLP